MRFRPSGTSHATRRERGEEVTAGRVYRQPTPAPAGPPTWRVDNRDEVKAFLSSRRARITPEQAGLTTHGRNRRVPGLRRGEVADLAGVSVEYYAQLERGNLGRGLRQRPGRPGPRPAARRGRTRPPGRPRPRRRSGDPAAPQARARQVRPGVRAASSIGDDRIPAIVNNGRLDLVAANTLGRRPCSRRCTPTPDPAAPTTPGSPSSTPAPATSGSTGNAPPTTPSPCCAPKPARDPYDRALTDLVGELCTRSDTVPHPLGRARRPPAPHRPQALRHPVVGDLHLTSRSWTCPPTPA